MKFKALSKKSKAKLYLELSKYFLDLSKLIFGGIVLSALFDLGFGRLFLLTVGLLAVVGSAIFGVIMFINGQNN
jgi:hypothetical protein